MIVLDTHVWYRWITQDHSRLSPRIIIATTLTLGANQASVDSHFPAYPELAGHLLGATS